MLVNAVNPGSMFYVTPGTTPVSVGTALAMAKQYPKTKFSISDTSENLSKNLDALLKIKNNITTIAQTVATVPMVVTATQLSKNASVLSKISTNYLLAVKQVTAGNADTIAATAHVSTVDVVDSSTEIGLNLDDLQANNKVVTITQSGRTSPMAITAAKMVTNATALGKITGFYNLAVTGANVAQALSYASDMKVKSVAIVDTSAQIADNLDDLAELGLRIKEIRSNESTALQVSAAQVKKDAFVIGKIYSNYHLAVYDATAAESAALTRNKKVVSIDIVDTGVNVVKNLSMLKKLGSELTSIEISDDSTPVSITAAQWSMNEDVVNKFKTGYKLAVTQVGAAYAQAMDIPGGVVDSISVSDTSSNIAATMDALQANTKLVSVTQTGPTSPMAITADQLANNADLLTKLTGSYSLAVGGVAAADAKLLATDGKVVSLAVTDTADGVDAKLNDLYALGKKLTSIQLTDSGGTINMTSAQYFDQSNLIDKITGGFSAAVSGLSAAKAEQVLADGNVATVQIKDTGANIARYLDSLQGMGAQITEIEQTDTAALTITATQYAANADALGKFKVAPTYNLTQVSAGAVTGFSDTKFVSLAVTDSSSNIAQNWDALRASSKINTITQVGNTTPIALTDAQFTAAASGSDLSSAAVFAKVVGTYSLSLANVAVSNAAARAANSKVVSMGISDTGSNIASQLDALYAMGKKVSSVKQSNAGVAMSITSGQWFSEKTFFNKMVGGYNLQVSGVGAAKAAEVLADGHVASIQVKDTGAQLSLRLSQLQNMGVQISEIEQTDTTPLAISQAQFTSAAGALDLFKVDPTFNLSAVSAASAEVFKTGHDDIVSLSVSDNSINIANQLDALKANSKLTAIQFTGDVTPLAVTATQLADAAITSTLAKINGSYNLNVSHVAAGNASTIAANSKVTAMSIDGTAATISTNLNDLVGLGKTVISVKQSDAGTPIEVTSAQWSSAPSLLNKIEGGYSVNVADVTAAKAVAVLADSHVAGVHIKDSGAHLAANINMLQSLGTQVVDIEQVGTTALTITAGQLDTNAVALGKFKVAPTYNITQARAADAATLAARTDVLSVTVSDSSANIAAYLDALQSNTELTSIVQTGVVSDMAISASQLASDADALAKISGAYTLAVSGVAAGDAATVASNSHVSTLSVSGASSAVATNFTNLMSNAKLTQINFTGGTLGMSLTQTQVLAGTSTLAKISGAYELTVSAATAENLDELDSNTHVVSIALSDTTDNITGAFDQLVAMGPKISGIAVTTHTNEIELTQDQLLAGADTVAKLSGTFNLAIADVSAENATNVAAMAHVTGLSVADTASNVAQHIDALLALGSELELITINDDDPIQLTQTQADAAASVLSKIHGSYTLEIIA